MLRRKDALHTKSLSQSGLPLPGFGFEKQICSVSLPPVRKSQSRHNSHEMNAMMKQSRLMWEFMLTVIGEKYRLKDSSFGRIDLNTYFMRLQEQDDAVATWSEGTITKLKQVLAKVLVENEYLDDIRADHLNPVYLHPILENAIRSHGDLMVLPAFNCFS